jgi:hypothetical protein
VKKVATAVANTVVAVAKTAIKIATAVVTGKYDPSIDTTFSINLGPKELVDSPFGQAYQLFTKSGTSSGGAASGEVSLYCVGCGVTGKIHISGAASFAIYSASLTSGFVAMDGNVHAGLELGLYAQAEYKQTFEKTIASAGLPGFSIPNIISVGPVIQLKAELDIDIAATGQLLVGATMDIPNFAARLDLVDSSGSYSRGFTPVFTPIFDVSGEISATAVVGLPLSVGIGIVCPLIKLDKTIAIVDKPALTANAKFVGGTGPAPEDAVCYNGVDIGVLVSNDIYLDFFGAKKVNLVTYTAPPLLSTCIS